MVATGRAIGIDFGTSTSFAAEGDPLRGVELAPLGRATPYLPSLIGVSDRGMVVGDAAGDLPERQIIRSIKRCIIERVYKIANPLDANEQIDVDEAIVTLLTQLAARTRDYVVELRADTIRLGCPAMWDAEQRTRLIGLAQRAGIPVAEHTLIDEPIAAGMAWVSQRVRGNDPQARGRLLVFDMGGGTFDVALLQVDTSAGEHAGEISVLSSKGVNEAGDALDLGIRDDLMHMLGAYELDLSVATQAELDRKLLTQAREAKILLSTHDEAFINIPMDTVRLPRLTYRREQPEATFEPQLAAAADLVWHVVRESFLTHDEHRTPSELRQTNLRTLARGVDRVLLAGGMSQIPVVRERLESMFPHAEIYARAARDVASDEAIVVGLAETTVYDRVNLHRPPFDFELKLSNGRRLTLYSAYSPLYEPWLASQRNDLYYECAVSTQALPDSGMAQLTARSAMGQEIHFRVSGEGPDRIDIPLGRRNLLFRIRPNGWISLTDGKGNPHQFRVNRWPVLRGKDHAIIQLERMQRRSAPRREHSWVRDPLFLH